ncbi:MAG: phage antirepressor KilAC domain-containing protein [Prevotella sp.]|nr:phage antirepressor KilAC domain-containing protein [Prevotella sp.]
MKTMRIFNHAMFGEIRTMVNEQGETFFVGKDVAVALGYSNPLKAVRDHVDLEDKTVNESFTVNGTSLIFINESGLYALILSSKLPQAKTFKRWVTSEVLPAIRKTGRYELTSTELKQLAGKAEYCDEVLESVSCKTTTQIAKELSMTVSDLTRLLEHEKVMYKQGRHWLLYADFARKGYAKSRTSSYRDLEGDLHTCTYLVWTEAGRRFIHRLCHDEEVMVTVLLDPK